MKRSIYLAFFLIVGMKSVQTNAQDLIAGSKTWYSTYLYFKLNKHFYIDDYILNGYNTEGHTFSFVQNDLALNYKLTKRLTGFVGVANYIYKWNPSYKGVYNNPVSRFGTISFLRGSVGLKCDFKFFKKFEMDQSLSFQYYYPSLEKYQSRIAYGNKISFTSRKAVWSLSPFIQAGLFYYLNGMPTMYYDSDGQFEGYYSSDGLHRARLKIGLKMKPFKKSKNFGMVLYYCVQKEFNMDQLGGHPLNTSSNRPMDQQQVIIYPFNNYSIYGVQFNFIFSNSSKR